MIRPRWLQPSIGKKFAVIRIVPTTGRNTTAATTVNTTGLKAGRKLGRLLLLPPGCCPGGSDAELSQAISRLQCLIRLGITLDDVAKSRDPSFLLS